MTSTRSSLIGSSFVTLAPQRARHADFPGWDAPNYADFFVDHPAGVTGTITHIESHGSNPWTRYSVLYADGSRGSGVYPAEVRVTP